MSGSQTKPIWYIFDIYCKIIVSFRVNLTKNTVSERFTMFDQNRQHQNVEWSLQQKHNAAFQPQEEKRKEEAEPSLEQDFAENTTLHGLNRLADPKKPIWLRIAWLLAVLACGGVCVWQISLRVRDYIAYDANTKISVLYRPKLDFPAVTICNFNRYVPIAPLSTHYAVNNAVITKY